MPPPAGFELALGVTLPIGTNRPNVYMAFGDSITQGDGSRGRRGYRDELQGLLAARFGRAVVENEGVSGTDSERGLGRLPDRLARQQPAFVLIHYGTNDWNGFGCRVVCGTAENLRRMVRVCREARSLPVVATLIPANPAFEDRLASARNAWIVATNVEVRAMAAAEGALLADLHAAFLREDPDPRAALLRPRAPERPGLRGHGRGVLPGALGGPSKVRSISLARFKLTLEYEGTRYRGFQVQKNARTVAGEIEEAVGRVSGRNDFELYGAGRTDAGVHALGQVAHLDLNTSQEPGRLRFALNDELPADISVLPASGSAGASTRGTTRCGGATSIRCRADARRSESRSCGG